MKTENRSRLVSFATAVALLLAPLQALAGNVHSTPDNDRDHVHKIHNPLPQKYKHTVGMTRDQKRMDKTRLGQEQATHRFSRREAREHEIHVHNGLLHKKDRAGNLIPYHTGNDAAKFVMKPSGKIIADHRIRSNTNAPIYHSSLSKGKRVAAAGEMRVEHGRLVSINNHSGHFKPPAFHHDQVIHELRHRGVRNFKSTTGFGGSRVSTQIN
jgi:hypothetical protein